MSVCKIKLKKMLLNVIITLLYTALAFTVAVPGYGLISKYVSYADLFESDSDLLKWVQYFVGMFIYLGANVISLGLLVKNFEEETTKTKKDKYLREVTSGFLKEVDVQTDSNLLVMLMESSNGNGIDYTTSCDRKISKEGPELPRYFKIRDRATSSTPALHFNSFSFNGKALLFAIDEFIVRPESCKTTFQDIMGLDELKQIILQRIIEPFASMVELESSSQTQLHGFDILRSILLIGERGSGKSSIVQAVFNELQATIPDMSIRFYKIDGANCFDSYIGSGASFREIFHFAQEQSEASIILIDNIDKLSERSVAVFLSELSAVPGGKMFVFATTSVREKLHESLLSNDDFDIVYELQPPTFQERVEILRYHFQKRDCSIKEKYLQELSNITESYSGGELEKLTNMINSKIMEIYYRAHKDIIKSITRASGYQQGDLTDMDVLPKGTTGSLKLKEVSRHHFISAHKSFEQRRLKRQLFTTGTNDSLSVSSIM